MRSGWIFGKAWESDPRLPVREIDQVVSWMVLQSNASEHWKQVTREVFPTVGHDGCVVLLSPELLGARSLRYGDFVVGNVLAESLPDIAARALDVPYVAEFIKGVNECADTCEFFSYCFGGDASNKFFELGSTCGTSTRYCEVQKKSLVDSSLRHLGA